MKARHIVLCIVALTAGVLVATVPAASNDAEGKLSPEEMKRIQDFADRVKKQQEDFKKMEDDLKKHEEATLNPLKGLTGVSVHVWEQLPPDIGLTKEQLQTDTELRLRKVGIRVFSEEEGNKQPGQARLVVSLDVMLGKPENMLAKIAVFSLRVSVRESATLERNRGFVRAESWLAPGSVGMVGTERIQELRGVVGDQVDQFCNAYLAANPK